MDADEGARPRQIWKDGQDMTFVVLAKAPSREAYDKITAAVDVNSDPPAGMLVHTATETADGVQVVDVWESREAADEFERTRLFPAMESSGAMPAGQAPTPQMLEPFDEWIRNS